MKLEVEAFIGLGVTKPHAILASSHFCKNAEFFSRVV